MPDYSMETAPLGSLLFQFTEIRLAVQTAAVLPLPYTSAQYTLLVVSAGSGLLQMNNQTIPFSADTGYLLPPGCPYSIEAFDLPLRYDLISFKVVDTAGQPKLFTGELLRGKRELIVHPFAKVLRLAEELRLFASGSEDQVELYRQQLKFQELLLFLFEHNYPSREMPGPARSVENTVQYIQEHYTDNITVKQLAEMAGIPLWQYTPIFQKLTGRKPLDYLAERRIERSKQHLKENSKPLREIARLVGFSDEYYFSRRFRQKTGIPPGQYALRHKHRSEVRDWTGHTVEIPERPRRIVYHGETMGDLLALGIRPVGGDEAFVGNSVYKHRIRGLADVGFPLDPQLTRSLQPDLIILANANEKIYDKVSGIAPTLTFDTFASLEQRMRILGDWLDRRQEAEDWIAAYTVKNAAMWQRLYRQSLHVGETASALIFDHGNRLFTMGTTGLSSGLYAPSGFRPPPAVAAILDDGRGFVEIEPAQLPDYTGDRIFMLVPEQKEERTAMERLMQSPLWHSIPAVRKGHVYLLDASRWNFGDALTREKLLTLLPKLLAGPNGRYSAALP